MMDFGEKICKKCGETKAATEFYARRNRSGGLQAHCKYCARAYQVLHRTDESVRCRQRAAAKRFREANPEKMRALKARYYAENRETCLARMAKHRAENRGADRARKSAYYRANREARLEAELRKKYGITFKEKNELLAAQGDSCAACGTQTPSAAGWNVDHDHVTGAVRGILCSNCNIGIGLLSDSVGGITAALQYLQRRLPVSEGWAIQ